jgi:cytochrome c oxidase subunit 3
MADKYFKINIERHPFHIVEPSIFPFLVSMNLFIYVFFFVLAMHDYCGILPAAISFVLLIKTLMNWFKSIWLESINGNHTKEVQSGIRIAFFLFILSEVMFFFSIFWAFFSASLVPTIEVGCVWPPYGLKNFISHSLINIPALNTMLLVTSGFWITCAHRFLKRGNYNIALYSMAGVIIIGFWFFCIQLQEFSNALYCINDSVYGSILYFGTGFHGAHILCGGICLAYETLKIKNEPLYIYRDQHVALECFVWYWHFVDIVWLFLWGFFYVWTLM